MPNVLSKEKRAAVLRCLTEGCSIRSTVRLTGVCKPAILRLLNLIGPACEAHHDRAVREVKCNLLELDEAWAFCLKKEAHLRPGDRERGFGDVWLWCALDPDSKLMVSYRVGRRESRDAYIFMHDLASRVVGRPQISTDGLAAYEDAIEIAFGEDASFGRVIKKFGGEGTQEQPERRYSPGHVTAIRYESVSGDPDPSRICTSHIERVHATTRALNRRYTRLTHAFSKRLENHANSVALHFTVYNFCRIHGSLRVTPAMAAGLTDHVWEIEEVVDLL